MAEPKPYVTTDHRYVRIDVLELEDRVAVCRLYTGVGAYEIKMNIKDYRELCDKGFFTEVQQNATFNIIRTSEEYKIPNPGLID